MIGTAEREYIEALLNLNTVSRVVEVDNNIELDNDKEPKVQLPVEADVPSANSDID